MGVVGEGWEGGEHSDCPTREHVLETLGLLAVDEAADAHQYRLRLPFRDERREADAPRPVRATLPTAGPPGLQPSAPKYTDRSHVSLHV